MSTMQYQNIPTDYLTLSREQLRERIARRKRELGSRLVVLGHHYQSDDVVAFAAGLTPVDAAQRMKDAIDRNESAQNATVQNFPETTLVFTTPTGEQLRTLSVLFSDNNWWEESEASCEETTSDESFFEKFFSSDELEWIAVPDEEYHAGGTNLTFHLSEGKDWSYQLTDQITVRSKLDPSDWPIGKIRVQSTLTDTTRTDRVRIGAEFWAN